MDSSKTPSQRKQEAPDALTVSVDRAAQLLGVSRASAYQAVRDGTIPALKFGRRIRIPRAALERALADAGAPRP